MAGYITYTESSALSPVGKVDPAGSLDAMLLYVSNNYELYKRYSKYKLQGPMSDLLNEAISLLFTPRREDISTGKYVYFLPIEHRGKKVRLPPVEFSIPIIRNIYMLNRVDNNMYKQINTIGNRTEQYAVSILPYQTDGNDTIYIPIYVGAQGSFLLVDDKNLDVTPILDILVSHQ